MPYQKVQFIAYRIYTCAAQNPRRYVGMNNDTNDVRQRVKLMTEAINAAAASNEINQDPDVLKVFIAPEFYFHSQRWAYPNLSFFTGTGAGRDPDSIVGGLADAVADKKWSDWLFAFGTAMVDASNFTFGDMIDTSSSNPLTILWNSLKRTFQLYGRRAVLNMTLVQKGGYDNEDARISKSVVVIKEYKSPIDFLKPGPAVYGLTDDRAAYFPAVGPGTYAGELNTPGGSGGGFNGGSIFLLDGITFGLEVCLDHARQRLVRAWPDSGDLFVQVQLVPSGGIIVEPTSIATRRNGLICNVDGLSNWTTAAAATSYGYHSQAFQVTNVDQPNALNDLTELTRLTTFDAHADLAQVTPVFWLPPSGNPADPNVWQPQIVIYNPAALPDPVAAESI